MSHELHLLLPPHKTKKQPSALGAGPSMPSWGHSPEEREPEQPWRILETKRKEKEKKFHNQFPSSNTLATPAPFLCFPSGFQRVETKPECHFPVNCCCRCCCCVASVVSDSVRAHRPQPTRLRRPWDSPGKNTRVGCHFLLQCMKVRSESEAAQSCLTLRDPMDCSPPGSSIHGIFQARVLEWDATAFSTWCLSVN